MSRAIRQEEDALLTFKEVMAYLRVSRMTVYRLKDTGQLPGQKVGSAWRFWRSDVRACIKQAKEMPRIVVSTLHDPGVQAIADAYSVTIEQRGVQFFVVEREGVHLSTNQAAELAEQLTLCFAASKEVL